jgi:hypothetical protein
LIKGRDNGWGVRGPLKLQMSEPRILIRLLWMYFPRNWEVSSALAKTPWYATARSLSPYSKHLKKLYINKRW